MGGRAMRPAPVFCALPGRHPEVARVGRAVVGRQPGYIRRFPIRARLWYLYPGRYFGCSVNFSLPMSYPRAVRRSRIAASRVSSIRGVRERIHRNERDELPTTAQS